MEAREQESLALLHLPRHGVDRLRDLQVHEPAQDVQPRVTLQHPFPQVRGRRALRVDWVARPAIVATVEVQEARRPPSSFVVMCTSRFDTAKWTSARRPNPSSGSPFGWRSSRYCVIACCTLYVKSVLSSIVATGRPLTKSTRSILFWLLDE